MSFDTSKKDKPVGQKGNDQVNHPTHYTSHPSGIEAIQICEHENFCVGNAIKYLFRAGKKGDLIEDLQKAVWYIQREIARLQREIARLEKSK